jgi:glutamyl-tRNA synthetase
LRDLLQEWLLSTPKHVELYKAFDWEPPQFAHLGLLVDKNRQKLSKRDNSANLEYYQDGHILPAALLNFAVLLGWRAPPSTKDVLTLQDMIDNVGDPRIASSSFRTLTYTSSVLPQIHQRRHYRVPAKVTIPPGEAHRAIGSNSGQNPRRRTPPQKAPIPTHAGRHRQYQ